MKGKHEEWKAKLVLSRPCFNSFYVFSCQGMASFQSNTYGHNRIIWLDLPDWKLTNPLLACETDAQTNA